MFYNLCYKHVFNPIVKIVPDTEQNFCLVQTGLAAGCAPVLRLGREPGPLLCCISIPPGAPGSVCGVDH